MILIGIAGRKGHGKDTAAQGLEGFQNVKFAAPLKEMLRTFLRYVGLPEATVERRIEGDLKEEPLECLGGRSARYAMQTLGTEWGRNLVLDDLWVNAFRLRASQFEHVVCTDMRFPNEVAIIKAMGGRTLRIVDPRKPLSGDDHPSETAIDNLPVDTEVLNNGSIAELQRKMRWLYVADVVNHDDAWIEGNSIGVPVAGER